MEISSIFNFTCFCLQKNISKFIRYLIPQTANKLIKNKKRIKETTNLKNTQNQIDSPKIHKLTTKHK